MKIISNKDFITKNWSGGQTTELAIYPAKSTFANRDFLYRISIATINISSSDFTPLPDVDRTLLLLEGELKLIHENHHESFLMAFSQDSFKGDWNTHSIGIAKDFNLMTKKGCKGKITVIGNNINYTSNANQMLILAYEDQAQINNTKLEQGSLMILENEEVSNVLVETSSRIIIVEIHFDN